MKLTGWSFTLEDDEREIKVRGMPTQNSFMQWGATNEELGHTVSLCEALILQAGADKLIEREE